jgi:uncharacterized protein YecT (DUF1311 family)
MKTRYLVVPAFFLVTCAAAVSAAENCKNPKSQLAMNTCAGLDFKREDASLNKNYQLLMAKTTPESQPKLKEVQLAWLKFRDLSCEYASASYITGSMYTLVNQSCLSGLTKQRNKDLRAMLDDAGR